MNNDTVEKLQHYIQKDIAWRKVELSFIKTSILSNSTNLLPASKSLIRGAITILYAHWEGAIKHMAIGYLEHVFSSKIPYKQLKNNFVALSLYSFIKQEAQSNKNQSIIGIIDKVLNEQCSQSHISDKNLKRVTSPNSNLSSERFKDMMLGMGLDYSEYETSFNLIDQSLLETRNNIAHGAGLNIDKNEYLEMHDKIINIIMKVGDQIIQSALLKSYIVANNSQSTTIRT